MAIVDLGVIPTVKETDVENAVNKAINTGWPNIDITSTDDGEMVFVMPEPFVPEG